MDKSKLRALLTRLQKREVTLEEVLARLETLPYEDLEYAKPDHHRALRRGFSEVILGEGKSIEQIGSIAQKLLSTSSKLLITRTDVECFEILQKEIPDAVYHKEAKMITVNREKRARLKPGIMVACGGTSDLPIAEEAAITAELMGNSVEKAYDVGIAGIHRIIDILPALRKARVVVAVAGMEGALPSVLAGLIKAPVIAVPTSCGYGTSFGGIAALLSMLNSCASGVATVNIDNGFGAGFIAALINQL